MHSYKHTYDDDSILKFVLLYMWEAKETSKINNDSDRKISLGIFNSMGCESCLYTKSVPYYPPETGHTTNTHIHTFTVNSHSHN